MFETLLAIAIGTLLAVANGANDVSNSIATLVGSGVTRYPRAVLWGALWTGAGAASASVVGGAMLSTFGAGLLHNAAGLPPGAALATLLGASGWVGVATRTGLPVSTTHALVGALIGVIAWTQGAGALRWSALGGTVFLPLLVSPFAALALMFAIRGFARSGPRVEACLCVEAAAANVVAPSCVAALAPSGGVVVSRGKYEECRTKRPAAIKLTLDRLHWIASGTTALARGLNDAPKIASLAAAGSLWQGRTDLPLAAIFALVAIGMIAGSLLAGRRVTDVLAHRVTVLHHRDGFVANGVTAALVCAGTIYGLPVSTTHVSSGAIFAAGALRGELNTALLRGIVLAWAVTLPAAGLLGIVGAAVLRELSIR